MILGFGRKYLMVGQTLIILLILLQNFSIPNDQMFIKAFSFYATSLNLSILSTLLDQAKYGILYFFNA
jgi:hypothetical protein